MLYRLTKLLQENRLIQAILFVLFLLALLELKGLILNLFVAFIIASTFNPLVKFLQEKKFPKGVALISPYLLSILFLSLIVFPIIPFINLQTQSLVHNFPRYLHAASSAFGIPVETADLQKLASAEINIIGRNILSTSTKIFAGIFSILTVVIVSFYLLAGFNSLNHAIVGLMPQNLQTLTEKIVNEVEQKLGAWVRGQIVLSFAVGILTLITLSIVQIPYALVLALIAGILEAIPTIGPIIAAVPALIVALSISPQKAIIIVLVYILIQVLENNLLVPTVMKKAVGLSPLVVLLGIIVGGQLLGLPGALLAIPFLSAAQVVLSNLKR